MDEQQKERDREFLSASREALSHSDTQLSALRSIFQSRIALYDRLILLSGASITLSFSAAASFHSHLGLTLNLRQIGSLEAAWCLLTYSMIALLISNIATVAAEGHSLLAHTAKSVATSAGILAVLAMLAGHKAGVTAEEMFKLSDTAKAERQRHFTEQIGIYLGASAILAIVFAFIFLLRFVIGNAALI